jgi:hypothetical protein
MAGLMTRILITGARAPVTRDLGHALSAAGHDVHLADVFRTRTAGRFSWWRYAAPVQQPDRFARDIDKINIDLKPDLIIPLCEEVFHLAGISGLPLFAPDRDTLLRLHSKFDFNQWVLSLGFDAPETHRAVPDDTERAATSVFKPEFSRFGARCLIRPAPEIAAKLAHDPANPWLRQDYIAGDDLCFHAIARAGRIRAFAAYRSDWRTSGGASYYFEPLPAALSQRLFAIAETLVAAGHLTGQIACDLRRDADGRLWLIECNPRGTSGLHLLAHDPHALAEAFLQDGGGTLMGSEVPVCLGPAMRLLGLSEAMQADRLDAWRRDRSRARDAFADVLAGAVIDHLGHSLRAVLRGKRLDQLLTEDIEYNGRVHAG